MIEVLSSAKFSVIIEEIVQEKQIPYIEAIVDYCAKHNLEVEQAAKLLNQKIKKKIKVEAEKLNFLTRPKEKLPF